MTGVTPQAPNAEASAALAERVVDVLRAYQIEALVIGGVALAAHHYLRSTEDLDLGVNASVRELRKVRDELTALGYAATLNEPDGDDALGGTIDVSDGSGALVQVVNFDNSPASGFPAVIRDALNALGPPMPGVRLRIVPIPFLVALKLYADGPKSRQDIRELLQRNPDANLQEIRDLCARYGLPVDGLF